MICNRPTVSVVIPCHNYGRYLAEAIDSALAQTCPTHQIIVVDNGSTDDTRAIARRYGDTVEYLFLPVSGVCAARNAGLDRVTSECVIFLDADDILDARYIEKTTALLQSPHSPSVAFVYTQRESFGSESGISKFPPYDSRILKERNFIMVNALTKTSVARQIGYDLAFDQGLEDYDFFLSLAEKGYEGRLLDEPLVKVRVHTSSTTTAVNATYRQVRLARQLIRKHSGFYSRQDRRSALLAARQRMLVAIVQNRHAERSWTLRLVDLWHILQTPVGLLQLWTQFRYTFDPALTNPLLGRNSK